MSFWNESNPKKPKGIKDPNSVIDYPISFVAWLAQEGTTYDSHEVLVSGGLVVDSSVEVGGVIIPRISGGTLGELATFTIRITTTNGLVEDRTFFLKVEER